MGKTKMFGTLVHTDTNPPIYPAGTLMRKGNPLKLSGENNEPLTCRSCGNQSFDWEVTCSIEGCMAEADILCGACGLLASRWAYGAFEPNTP